MRVHVIITLSRASTPSRSTDSPMSPPFIPPSAFSTCARAPGTASPVLGTLLTGVERNAARIRPGRNINNKIDVNEKRRGRYYDSAGNADA